MLIRPFRLSAKNKISLENFLYLSPLLFTVNETNKVGMSKRLAQQILKDIFRVCCDEF